MTDNVDDHPAKASDGTTPAIKAKPGWTGWATMVVAGFAVLVAGVAAWYAGKLYSMYELALGGGTKPAYQAVCLVYSDFVLTQAHNGYTPEQIQHVIDFAGSHEPMPGSAGPERFSMPNRWPTISDEKACGSPAEIISHAKA